MTQFSWTPAELLKTSSGFWLSSAIHAGVKLDLFSSLGGESLRATDLATRLQLNERGLAMLLDALVALELLQKEGADYRNSPFAEEFLCRESPKYLGHIIRHHHHLVDSWRQLDESVRQGGPVRKRLSHEGEEIERESFLLGMFNLAMQIAPQIVDRIDLAGRQHLLDLGGGPGTYAIHFCRKNPELRATIFDLPTTESLAKDTIARFALQQRINFTPGDFQLDAIGEGYDVAWLSHVLHGEDEQGCAAMLAKTFAALERSGRLLIHEFVLDDSRDRPLFPALFSLNMLVGTPGGKAYSEGEIGDLISAAGFVEAERLPILLPNGAAVISARKPG
ncbi:MAG: methyltransferase [Desulfuromonadales bacterium]|nr:methyltransferase [Desulfuromonadales bacterium]